MRRKVFFRTPDSEYEAVTGKKRPTPRVFVTRYVGGNAHRGYGVTVQPIRRQS